MEFDPLSNRAIGCALEVHRALGLGLLESTDEQCPAYELGRAEIRYKLQYPFPVQYKGIRLDCEYRVDVPVEDTLILELKSVDVVLGIHQAQLLTYMKLANIKIVLLITSTFLI